MNSTRKIWYLLLSKFWPLLLVTNGTCPKVLRSSKIYVQHVLRIPLFWLRNESSVLEASNNQSSRLSNITFWPNPNMRNEVYRNLFSLKLLQLALHKKYQSIEVWSIDWNECYAKICFDRQSWTKYLAQSWTVKLDDTKKLWHLRANFWQLLARYYFWKGDWELRCLYPILRFRYISEFPNLFSNLRRNSCTRFSYYRYQVPVNCREWNLY